MSTPLYGRSTNSKKDYKLKQNKSQHDTNTIATYKKA